MFGPRLNNHGFGPHAAFGAEKPGASSKMGRRGRQELDQHGCGPGISIMSSEVMHAFFSLRRCFVFRPGPIQDHNSLCRIARVLRLAEVAGPRAECRLPGARPSSMSWGFGRRPRLPASPRRQDPLAAQPEARFSRARFPCGVTASECRTSRGGMPGETLARVGC